MNTLKIGAIQFDVRLGDVEANLDQAFNGIRELGENGTALAVLPEMWTCGFDNEHLAEHSLKTPEILDRLRRSAMEYKMVIAGSMPEMSGPRIHNTLYVVDTDGTMAGEYRKIHLFCPTGEDKYYTPGFEACVCETAAGRLGLITCYDLRFPELARTLALRKAEILIVPAQWPAARISHWDILLAARAIENQVFAVASNRVGRDGDLVFGGHSQVVTPLGETVATAGDEAANISVDIDMSRIASFRDLMPCLKERVPGAYEI